MTSACSSYQHSHALKSKIMRSLCYAFQQVSYLISCNFYGLMRFSQSSCWCCTYLPASLLFSGNADGLGPVRTQELFYACSVLGIQRNCVTVIDDARLPDGMRETWSPQVVAEHAAAAIVKHSINTVSVLSWQYNLSKLRVLLINKSILARKIQPMFPK